MGRRKTAVFIGSAGGVTEGREAFREFVGSFHA